MGSLPVVPIGWVRPTIRSLQRRQVEADVQYADLVEGMRGDAAVERLGDSGIRLVDVAHGLGYSDRHFNAHAITARRVSRRRVVVHAVGDGAAARGRSIPSLLSRCSSVLGCSPNRSAAFDLPLMRQPHSCNTRRT